MSKHTPGPWTADRTRVYIGDNPKDVGSETDASLIAAAPDLLEALKEIIAQDNYEGFGDPASRGIYCAEVAAAAIAKAEGGEK